MTRNRHKMIKQMGDSLLLSKHSIQLLALILLLSGYIWKDVFQKCQKCQLVSSDSKSFKSPLEAN